MNFSKLSRKEIEKIMNDMDNMEDDEEEDFIEYGDDDDDEWEEVDLDTETDWDQLEENEDGDMYEIELDEKLYVPSSDKSAVWVKLYDVDSPAGKVTPTVSTTGVPPSIM